MRTFLSILLLCASCFNTTAQDPKIIVGKSYFGSTINEKEICDLVAFTTRPEVSMAVESIVKRSGLKQNFYVMECPSTNNCFAATRNGERLIVYDAGFFEKLNSVTKTHWAALSILAHEIGHHLQGHTIKNGGSDHDRELEADEFSGFVMYQMGASLGEAQSAISMLTTEYSTGTHPPKSIRLSAIARGYDNARELYPQVNNHTEETPDVVRTGCVNGNCTDGFGVAINSKTYEKYEGEWKMGKREGYGMEYFSNGKLKYKGEFSGGKYHGSGVLIYDNGDRYEGGFYKGKPHGKNTKYIFKSGDVLTVNYINGQRQGFGILTQNGGKTNTVYFRNNRRLR